VTKRTDSEDRCTIRKISWKW